jgi:hypothetical protein
MKRRYTLQIREEAEKDIASAVIWYLVTILIGFINAMIGRPHEKAKNPGAWVSTGVLFERTLPIALNQSRGKPFTCGLQTTCIFPESPWTVFV